MNRFCIVGAVLTAAISAQQDIVSTAVGAGKFKTLVSAVKAAKLVGTLQGKGPFTVFAPTDAAFAKLDQHALRDLLKSKNRGKLQNLLTYHVAAGKLSSSDVLSRNAIATVQGQRVPVMANGDMVKVGNAGLVATDIVCSNGIIHVIDTVLQPETRSIPEVASAAGSFQTLLAAAKAAGLVDTLSGSKQLTVLAPTDKAFAKLPKGTVQSLLRKENRSQLARILSYHVIPSRVFASQAIAASSAKTVQGDAVRFGIDNGRLRVNEANIIGTDIQAGNGVIHVIDSVLMPPKPKRPAGRLIVGVNIEKPSAALAAQLNLHRSSALLVTGVTRKGNAERAGVKRYDIWTSVNGMAATEANLKKAKEQAGYDGQVEVKCIRGGKTKTLKVTVGVDPH